MPNKRQVQKLFNIIARALRVIETFPDNKNEIIAINGFYSAFIDTKEYILSVFNTENDCFLLKLEEYVVALENETSNIKYAKAFALCLVLDTKISYLQNVNNAFSVYSLVPIYSNHTTILREPLNTDYKDTGIWINPRLPVSLLYEDSIEQGRPRRLFNRDSYMGINGEIKNFSYTFWDEIISITNILMPNDFLIDNPSCFRVAFTPLSNRNDLLEIKIKTIKRNGIDYRGESLKKLNHSNELLSAYCNAWSVACETHAHLFFAPEMLCSKDMATIDNGFNTLIHQMISKKESQHESVPVITILPSYWRNHSNSCQLVSQSGEVIGEQYKYMPYVQKDGYIIESLKNRSFKEIIIIHIPDVHRVAVMICSDFLTNQENWLENYICKQLLPTLIIVPSFSSGEQDFINSLPITQRYGTSIIWGNCCGAKEKGEKQIGGCSVVGIDGIKRFKDEKKCKTCEGLNCCLFTIDIPLKIVGNRIIDSIKVNHILKSDKLE